MKKSNVYTMTGDGGTTSLVGGKRIKKNDVRLEAYGTVDEVNSFIGDLAAAPNLSDEIIEIFRFIQNKLFNIGSYLATDNPNDEAPKAKGVDEKDIERVEKIIDKLDAALPPTCRFLLPGGSIVAAKAHICRSVTRRCERRVLDLAETSYVDPNVIKFINRLSDLFFVVARHSNNRDRIDEIFWDKDC